MQRALSKWWPLLVICLMLAILFCGFFGPGLVLFANDLVRAATWRDKTTPLRSEVVQDLCVQLSLPPTDPKCQAGAVVYAPDFFTDIRRAFPASGEHPATVEQIQAKLGRYEFKREPTVSQADGLEYFVIRYDLRGDRVYPMVLFFYSDGRLFRLIADIGD